MPMKRKKMSAENVVIADNFLSRARGLMFSFPKKVMILSFPKPGKYAIHMWFVFYPITILWLDEKKRIVQMNENVKPFTCCAKPKHPIAYIVEIPQSLVRRRYKEKGTFVFYNNSR